MTAPDTQMQDAWLKITDGFPVRLRGGIPLHTEEWLSLCICLCVCVTVFSNTGPWAALMTINRG